MDRNELLEALKPEAKKIDEAMQEDLASVESDELADILNHAIFQGGKRIRPLLTVFSCRLIAASDEKEKMADHNLYRLAMVFEYLHAASLLHDDVIDNALQRRGRPAANRLWGVPAVILAGDFLHVRAMMLAGAIGGGDNVNLLGRAIMAMIEAEFLQKKIAEEKDQSEDLYFSVLNGKTAALISSACEAGILYAGGTIEERKAVAAYGGSLGLAFQVIDDLLDYLGDPAKTGKSVGNDFVEGKMTLPLIKAFSQAPPQERYPIETLLAGDSGTREAHIDEARNFIDNNKGFESSMDLAKELINKGCRELEIFPSTAAKEVLNSLANYVLTRKK